MRMMNAAHGQIVDAGTHYNTITHCINVDYVIRSLARKVISLSTFLFTRISEGLNVTFVTLNPHRDTA